MVQGNHRSLTNSKNAMHRLVLSDKRQALSLKVAPGQIFGIDSSRTPIVSFQKNPGELSQLVISIAR
jgi:hypothetical protein